MSDRLKRGPWFDVFYFKKGTTPTAHDSLYLSEERSIFFQSFPNLAFDNSALAPIWTIFYLLVTNLIHLETLGLN